MQNLHLRNPKNSNQIILFRHTDELGDILHFKFVDDVFAVGIHGERAQKKFFGDGDAGFSLG